MFYGNPPFPPFPPLEKVEPNTSEVSRDFVEPKPTTIL